MVTVANEQSLNAFWLIDVTEAGMIIDVKPEPSNAFMPINVTELGMVIDVKLEQPENA